MGNVDHAECYVELANAIVLQAFKDYRSTLWNLTRHPNDPDAARSKKSLERFFDSEWYKILTTVDAEILKHEEKKQVEIKRERWNRATVRQPVERQPALAM